MDLQSKKQSVGTEYYRQIELAVDKNVPQSYLQTIIDEYTTLQLELQKRDTQWSDVQTLCDLVSALESEVKNYNG